jgi:hypothetical protein
MFATAYPFSMKFEALELFAPVMVIPASVEKEGDRAVTITEPSNRSILRMLCTRDDHAIGESFQPFFRFENIGANLPVHPI